MKKQDAKKGAALLIVMIIMSIIGVLAVGAMSKGGGLAITAERTRQSEQALWYCEQGMAMAIQNCYNKDFNDFSENVTLGGETVQVDVTFTPDGTNDKGHSLYKVESQVGHQKISQIFAITREPGTTEITFTLGGGIGGDTHPDYPEITLVMKNDSTLGSNSGEIETIYIDGNIFTGGSINLEDLLIMASGGYNKTVDGITVNAEIPDATAILELLQGQMDDFAQIIDDGASSTVKYSNNMTLMVPEGETIILGPGSVSAAKSLTINGTGTVIVQGDLTVKQSLTVNHGASLLVEGNMDVKNNLSFSDPDSVLYVGGSFTAQNNATVNGTLLVNDYIVMKNGSAASAFIFCNGYIEFKNSADLTGIVISNQLIAKNSAEFYVDYDVISTFIKELLATLGGSSTTSSTDGDVINVACSDWTKETT